MDIEVIRAQNLAWLTQRGFKVAPHLPMDRDTLRGLRSVEEIATRLMALHVLFSWVAAPTEKIATRTLREAAQKNDLKRVMTENELEMFKLGRHDAHTHVDSVGWKLENMWGLAWVLGFDKEPPLDGEMIDGHTIKALTEGYLPKLGESVDVLMRRAKMQPLEKVARLEDRFYCCHNAVRSAQLGGDTVPKGFDPVTNGGVIHERRHALTWSLSPGTSWEDTDLST